MFIYFMDLEKIALKKIEDFKGRKVEDQEYIITWQHLDGKVGLKFCKERDSRGKYIPEFEITAKDGKVEFYGPVDTCCILSYD